MPKKFHSSDTDHLDTKGRINFYTNKIEGGCWEWIGYLSANGYPILTIGKATRVHRYIYEQLHGKLEKGICVLHKCDNRKCINPDHLFIGTDKENKEDMKLKGRLTRDVVTGRYLPTVVGYEYARTNNTKTIQEDIG